MPHRWMTLFLLLSWSFIHGCASPTTSDILTDAFAPVEVLPVQAGDYAYLAWLDQEQLVVQYDSG